MKFLSTILFVAMCATPLSAANIAFDNTWKTINFPLKSKTKFALSGGHLGIDARSSASMVYRFLPSDLQKTGSAEWSWSVDQSVPATNLAVKGGDDRNIALYFLFMNAADAAKVTPKTRPSALLNNKNARVLVYVWGGDSGRNRFIGSPYLGSRGKTIIKRPAGNGAFSESVNLASDFQKAFGTQPENLVGIAISSDSDDTKSTALARVSGLKVK